jgi:hypothetical protein
MMPQLFREQQLLVLTLRLLAGLVVLFLAMVLWGIRVQVGRNRYHRYKIACRQRWEREIATFLFEGGKPAPFRELGPEERRLFIPFLLRVLSCLGGQEAQLVLRLYRDLGLDQGLPRRLRDRRPAIRALAALEVGSFHLEDHFPRLVELLKDTSPIVSYAAARSLSGSRRTMFVGPVMEWALSQEVVQEERILLVLEAFGMDLIAWLEFRIRMRPGRHPREWRFYAQLVAALRQMGEPDVLLDMLKLDDLELQCCAIKALAALGTAQCAAAVLPFAKHPSWILRAQAATAIGKLAGPLGTPVLLGLLCDGTFEVRRNAAHALVQCGPAGIEVLRKVARHDGKDPYARDLALERVQWLQSAENG